MIRAAETTTPQIGQQLLTMKLIVIAAFGGEDILAKTEADPVENEVAVFE